MHTAISFLPLTEVAYSAATDIESEPAEKFRQRGCFRCSLQEITTGRSLTGARPTLEHRVASAAVPDPRLRDNCK